VTATAWWWSIGGVEAPVTPFVTKRGGKARQERSRTRSECSSEQKYFCLSTYFCIVHLFTNILCSILSPLCFLSCLFLWDSLLAILGLLFWKAASACLFRQNTYFVNKNYKVLVWLLKICDACWNDRMIHWYCLLYWCLNKAGCSSGENHCLHAGVTQ